ncbi:ABC transporter permease subunit [Solibacillus sp. MA9]|uniref:ABC transporter permease subunit n=1 Tax=Solibacillus palustris TaxID=2908203 RepID=A0ABS9UEE6_9BACL|nr:ABC transporter permease subunit [Solibacillus sp. MA9]MCH7322530.1 ABC transporter permease subunit [Solibacillus sp. MA9]
MQVISIMQGVKQKNNRIQIKLMTKSSLVMRIVLWSFAVFTIMGPFLLNYGTVDWGTAASLTLNNLKMMFLQPAFNQITFTGTLIQISITLALALLATVLGAIIAFFLAIFSAKNLAPAWLSNVIIAGNSFVRAVPTVLWVLIFAIVAGLGAVACVIGMIFHTVAYLTKAFAESFEELDEGTIEALRASGANWWHIIFGAVVPQSSSYIVSWTFLRFESNYGVAVAMGAAAAAGGIGFDLFMSSSFYYDLHEVGMITYCALIVAIILELISIRIKKKLMAQN